MNVSVSSRSTAHNKGPLLMKCGTRIVPLKSHIKFIKPPYWLTESEAYSRRKNKLTRYYNEEEYSTVKFYLDNY